MNSATIKIDSYKNHNTILLDGKPVQINSELMNYYSKPIISVADKILATIESEYNDHFAIEVFGNTFEQALFLSLSKKSEDSFCEHCTVRNPIINLPTEQRLALIADYLPDNTSVPMSLITDIQALWFPQYDKLFYNEEDAIRLVVSADVDFIRENAKQKDIIIAVDCDAAILKQFKKNCAVVCSSSDVQNVVNDCVNTCFINPLIAKTVADNYLEHNAEKGIACLTQPLYFAKNEIKLEGGDCFELPLQSIPVDADKSHITITLKGTTAKIENNKITGSGNGTSEISLFDDCPIPFSVINVAVRTYNFVKNITIDIDADSDVLCAETEYKTNITFEPENAEDIDSLEIEITDPDVAEYKDGKIIIKQAGEFGILAKTTEANALVSLIAKSKIKEIKLSEPPKRIYIGDTFEVTVSTTPKETYNSKYKWVTSNPNVAVVGVDKDGREMIKANGVGRTTITCISTDDENIFASMEIFSDSTFNKRNRKQIFRFFGAFFAIISLALSLLGSGTSPLIFCSIIATLTLVISIIRKEETVKSVLFLAVTIFSLIYKFFLK